MKTGICTHPIFLEHDTGLHHPESSQRLESIYKILKEKSYYNDLLQVSPIHAKEEDITRIHSIAHYNNILHRKGKSGYLDGDTPYSEKSVEAALMAAGAGITLADKILEGECKNGMLLLRPPGHHAEPENAMGFCIFNNIAITAKYLQNKGLKKILILDWDVHHGNGTEDSFYEDDSVYFISTHQYPFYPGTGKASDTGEGKGRGYNLNLPFARGSSDQDYLKIFGEKILPAIESFEPEFILISAGFDAHKRDPLAGIELSTTAYEKFTSMICKTANEICSGRILSFLEGGYDLEALGESVEAHISVLKG